MCSLFDDSPHNLGVGSWKLGVGLFAALAVLVPPASAAGRAVAFRSEDGRTINAIVYEPSQRPAPAVVLVPMLGRPKEDWDAFGLAASALPEEATGHGTLLFARDPDIVRALVDWFQATLPR